MTRKENLERCKKLLYESITNYPLGEDDFKYLTTEIFPLHKKWEEKCGGNKVRSVIVHKHPEYHNLCFALVLDNNTIVDISFLECINRSGLAKDINSACKSAIKDLDRNEKTEPKIIKDWIKTFDNEELTVGKYLADDINADEKIFSSIEIINNFREFYTSHV